ncbi:hypothetical protein G7048_27845 (plasmid) [Diaphorobacter sp. HDW4B]|uniref:DUF7661 family protein n=1 Tax=Diaphorobacter sp. HDW4B TaxID=2714925 RepID=UPI001408CDD2|nr:hypothetical protein [Diaphorobacter sp. HDW4B]QIL74281.1 hypothetical protein G7048_27845 [Diaphorobacter sp. HDW4B]
MQRYRFNVFGRIVDIERVGDGWRCLEVGNDGKRAPMQLAVPSDIPANELVGYLYAIYHEMATPTNGDVHPMSSE